MIQLSLAQFANFVLKYKAFPHFPGNNRKKWGLPVFNRPFPVVNGVFGNFSQ